MELLPARFLKTAQRSICFDVAFSLLNVIVLFLTFTVSLFDSCALFQGSRPSSPFNSSYDSMPSSYHQATLLMLDILNSIPKIIFSAIFWHWNTVLPRRENRQWKSCLHIACPILQQEYLLICLEAFSKFTNAEYENFIWFTIGPLAVARSVLWNRVSPYFHPFDIFLELYC